MPRVSVVGLAAVMVLAGWACGVLAATDAEREAEHKAAEEWRTQREKVLADVGRRDILDLADELWKGLDKADGPTADAAIIVFIKASMPDRTAAAARRLCSLRPSVRTLQAAANNLDDLKQWDVLKIVFDAQPDLGPCGGIREFIQHMQKTASKDEVEAWLKVRYEAHREAWGVFYCEFLDAEGKLAPVLARLRKEIPKSPDDYSLVQEYLLAYHTLSHHNAPSESLAWLADVSRPKFAADAFDLGRELQSDRLWAEAIKLFDHSLTRPIADHDREWLRHQCQVLIVDTDVEPTIRRWTKADLALCCKESGDLKRAQKLVEELVGPNATLADLSSLQLAGQVQAASGQRVVEKKVLDAEAEDKNSVNYWLARASYYTGRKENDKAEDAFRQALALPPDAARPGAVIEYMRWLQNNKRYSDAEKLLRAEFARLGPNGQRSGLAFYLLGMRKEISLSTEDTMIWEHLAGQKAYGWDEQLMLRFIVSETLAAKVDEVCGRVVKLAGPTDDPHRAICVGQAMAEAKRDAQAVPLLEDAWARGNKNYPFDGAVRMLYEIRLRQGDWQAAEKHFRQYHSVRDYLNEVEVADALGRLAVAAATKGDKAAALRLWKERSNRDLANLQFLGDMIAAGMKDALKEYYGGLDKRAPGNTAVAEALRLLAAP
jgi:tetratricopeptide (TPR) repeat protein